MLRKEWDLLGETDAKKLKQKESKTQAKGKQTASKGKANRKQEREREGDGERGRDRGRDRDRVRVYNKFQTHKCASGMVGGIRVSYYFSSSSANAARTAAITKLENVQSFPWIACSTCSTTLEGKRTVLLTVGGLSGILNFAINNTSHCKCTACSLQKIREELCIAFAMHK